MTGAKELNRFIAQGKLILDLEEPVEAHSQFGHWLNNVSNWLSKKAPESGLAEEWRSIGTSVLLTGSRYYNDQASWNIFRGVVRQRLDWLKNAGPQLDRASRGPGEADAGASKPSRVHVHGPEGVLRETVTAFIKRLHIPMLPAPPGKARNSCSAAESLDFSMLGFAVILFAKKPSSSTGPFSHTGTDDADPVLQGVLDLGFFLGRMGARRVCALREPGLSVSLNSVKGLFVEADPAGAWQIALARSLRGAGIALDMNRVL